LAVAVVSPQLCSRTTPHDRLHPSAVMPERAEICTAEAPHAAPNPILSVAAWSRGHASVPAPVAVHIPSRGLQMQQPSISHPVRKRTSIEAANSISPLPAKASRGARGRCAGSTPAAVTTGRQPRIGFGASSKGIGGGLVGKAMPARLVAPFAMQCCAWVDLGDAYPPSPTPTDGRSVWCSLPWHTRLCMPAASRSAPPA